MHLINSAIYPYIQVIIMSEAEEQKNFQNKIQNGAKKVFKQYKFNSEHYLLP